ncbi:MAG: protein kinase [Thermodesulfovibrionales bacterium]|nr:protein kinase [Thermodesulfovibrionales bacterium]
MDLSILVIKLARARVWLSGVSRKKWFPGAALTVLMLVLFVAEAKPLLHVEYKLYDALASMRQVVPDSDVVLVGVDDYTISKLGPAPRMALARVIRRLSGLDARAVGVEMLFQDEEISPALTALRELVQSLEEDKQLLKDKEARGIYKELLRAEHLSDSDDALLKALKVKTRLVFPLSYFAGDKEVLSPPSYVTRHSLESAAQESGRFWKDLAALSNPVHALRNPVVEASRLDAPFQGLAKRSMALGHTSVVPDWDGVARRERLLVSYAGRLYPSISLQMALRHRGLKLSDHKGTFRERGVEGLNFGGLKIPAGSGMDMLTSPMPDPPMFSFMDVLDGMVPEDAFKGRAVLIGDISKGALRYRSSDGRMLTALEFHARSIQDMLSGSQVVRPVWAFGLEFLVMAYFGVFVSFILPRVRLRAGVLIMALSLVPLWVATFAMMLAAGYWLMAGSATLFLVSGFAIVTGLEYVSLGGKSLAHVEAVESNKMLGLSFQGQGMLDLALEKFMRCPVRDPSVKDLLYNLALDFERKRMPHKAKGIYEHILSAGPYKDAADRLAAITGTGGDTSVRRGAPAGTVAEGTVVAESTGVYHTLGRYEVISELGRGAMGTVYLGRDPKINRDVAIKTLLYEDVDPDELESVKERFFKEAEASGRLSHPNIMTMFDAGEEHDLAYLAMEVLKGEDLKKYCLKENLLPHREVIKIVADIADALAYAHLKGVVHRDIKPANIMRLEDGTVKVTDFGIARVVESSKTHTGTVLGTPDYMSPEQVEGKKVSGPSDLFSLGVMFYELLAGKKPFGGDSITTIMFNITRCKYISVTGHSADIPKCCSEVIDGLLVKSINKRYSDGAQVALDLRACLEDL